MASTSASLFSRAAPLQTSYDGAQTLWYPALRSTLKPKVVLIFICGNPGLASFYTKFLTTIHRHSSLKGRIEIFAVSHRGHALVSPVVVGGTNEAWSAEEASQGIRTSLYDQVRHKVDILDSVRRVYPRAPAQTEGHNGASRSSKDVKVVLVGHSIGAYIALEVLRARRRDVDGIHLLFPTLSHIAQTPNAKSLQMVLHPLTATLLLPLPLLVLSLLPLVILLPLIRIFTMQPASSAQSTAELLLTRGAVINALAMARDEMRIVQGIRPEIKEAVRSFVRRRPADGGAGHIHAYWGKGESDGWTPSWLRAQVEDELRMDRVTLPNARNDVQQPNSRHRNGTLMVAPFQTPPPSLRSRSSSMHLGASPRRRTSTLLIPGGSNEPLHSPTNGFSDSEPPHSPPSSMRLRQLSSAIAKRNFDGSITIERAVLDSDEESNKASTVEGTAAGSVLGSLGVDDQPILFEDPDEISSSDEQTAPGKEKARDGKRVGAGLLTSTVCEIGMPHAFCLKFGTEMGNIVAQWIQQDHF
ncbi:unnamed protein product [Tilletia laevis]|uniref:Uncharacterized protein n=1 Tax=Tilletia caries TaxID=13290 RepID=A0A177T209_9BASI|nr:hypothetical protein CF336_g8917 [Tilletia laevis]KAE8238898.1 hypothetical protein A4X03_0g8747 [Tilletia caries]CAD6932175.1 unnamed protein product [Tilletia controversa]KAE8194100.1 hypothetical protein CF335_g5427 [Tilletia laevis]CAD6902551.1 unnamed protein product [Tilletia laevis]